MLQRDEVVWVTMENLLENELLFLPERLSCWFVRILGNTTKVDLLRQVYGQTGIFPLPE